MSKSTSANSASASMQDVEDAGERKEQQTPAASTAAAAALVPSAADARTARLARRSQLRDESEPDAAQHERRRMEALATKAAARESCRASTLAPQLQTSCGPAQRLFADGIASCLGFLSLPDFLSAARSCKQFRAAAVKVKSLGAVELCDVAGPHRYPLPLIAASPFRHLVTSIFDSADSDIMLWMNQGRMCHTESGWEREHFALLLELGGLTELSLRIDLSFFESDATPIRFPARLQQVFFDLGRGERGWCPNDGSWDVKFDATPLLRGLVACTALTALHLRIVPSNPVNIDAVSELKQIKHFSFRSWHAFRFTPALLRAIRGLPLESLGLVCNDDDSDFAFDAARIGLLLAEPNQLRQLQTLTLGPWSWMDPSLSLSSLPMLTSLEPEAVSVSVLPRLSDHPKLRSLQLVFDGVFESNVERDKGKDAVGDRSALDEHKYIRAAVVLPHLKPLAALTSLHIEHVAFAAADFALLSQTLPLLEVLTLYDDALTSLGGLASLPSLRELTLSLAKHAEVADVAEHVGQCKSLEKLELYKMSPALRDTDQIALKPPSVLLPLLQSFECSAR